MKKIIVVLVLIILFVTPAYSYEAKYKQKAELYIINGVVLKSQPHAYVTLDIQDDKVIYKEITDWKNNTVEHTGGEFQIVSHGETMMIDPAPLWLSNIKRSIWG